MKQLLKSYTTLRYKNIVRRYSKYGDRISASYERQFYIYYLGRYLSKPYYTFGETSDMYSTECLIQSKVPYYKLIRLIPIEDNVLGLKKFEDFIENNKSELPLQNNGVSNVFALDDNVTFELVICKVDSLFQSSTK